MLDWNNKKTYWIVDNNMMIINNNVEPYDDGKYDSIEKTNQAYFAYKDYRFIEGIKSCWVKTKRKYWFGYYYKGQRFPSAEYENIGISRDHTIYSFAAFKTAGWTDKEIWEYASHMRFNLAKSIGMKMTPSLWLWLRLISNKCIGKLFYPLCWFEMYISNFWNKTLDKITGGFGPEVEQNEFKMTYDKPASNDWLVRLYYPNYALKLVAFQLDVLPDSKWKTRIEKQCLKITKETNYLLHIMFHSSTQPTEEMINNYIPMQGDRWSGVLNKWINDRYMKTITDPKLLKANTLDKDFLIEIYKKYKL